MFVKFAKSKLLAYKLILFLLVNLILINFSYAKEVITIAASSVPHAEILKQAKKILEKQNIDLQIKEFDDYIQPNLLVANKQMDANFFQHRPYLAQFNKDHHTNLVELSAVQTEPLGIYIGNKDYQLIKKLVTRKEFNANSNLSLIVGVPNDTVNEGRALRLLQAQGLIELPLNISYPTVNNITSNPYHLKFKELDGAMLARALKLGELSFAVINSNYALLTGLNPIKDASVLEKANSPYVNIVVVRAEDLNTPKLKALAQVLHSKEIKQYIIEHYKGAVVTAF